MDMRTEFEVASKETIFANTDKKVSSWPLSENVHSSISRNSGNFGLKNPVTPNGEDARYLLAWFSSSQGRIRGLLVLLI